MFGLNDLFTCECGYKRFELFNEYLYEQDVMTHKYRKILKGTKIRCLKCGKVYNSPIK